MRILVVSPQPFYSARGTPLSVYYRTLVLSELGARIDLLTYGDGVDVDIPNVRIVRIPRIRWLGPVKIGPSPLKAVLDCIMLMWTTGLLMQRRYDIVHAHEESIFWCVFLKPLFRFKLVYDMHSSLPQQLINFRFSSWRPLIRLFELLERIALRRSDGVITICPDLQEYALQQGIQRDRHFLIENSIFEPVRLSGRAKPGHCECRHETPAFEGPYILYAGTFEPYQGIDLLLRAFALVHAKRPNTVLVLIGGTPAQVREMKRLVTDLGIGSSTFFLGPRPKEDVLCYTRQAEVLVSPRREGTNTPLKVYEQLASGKPLVATNIWSHTQVLNGDVCILVEPEPESMAQGIQRAIDNPEEAGRIAVAAQRLFEVAYSRDKYVQKMRRLLETLE